MPTLERSMERNAKPEEWGCQSRLKPSTALVCSKILMPAKESESSLKNNPALFESWAFKPGQEFKADGRVFSRVH